MPIEFDDGYNICESLSKISHISFLYMYVHVFLSQTKKKKKTKKNMKVLNPLTHCSKNPL